MTFEIGIVVVLIAYAAGVVVWIYNQLTRIKAETKIEIQELFNKDVSSLGKSVDRLREQVVVLNQVQDEHSKRISQADTIFVHMDETMRGLSGAVRELNSTLHTLQIVVAKMEGRGN